MKCSKCHREATRRLTPDLDIGGIPVCDSYDCEMLVAFELLIEEIYESDNRQAK